MIGRGEAIRPLILRKLSQIEADCQVRILHAAESGSRAWGFASPDSDYDVRFIYVRKKEAYLRLEDTADHIEWELNEVLDINGWDIAKVLRLFHKSNATPFEWALSPEVYYTTPQWRMVYERASAYFSKKAAMYHYYGTARSNYQAHLLGEQVKYKKYFYVLRPILCCQWIASHGGPPPVRFDDMKNELEDQELRRQIDRLQEQKVRMTEAEKGPRADWLNQYIENWLSKASVEISRLPDDRTPQWEPLNEIFCKLLEE